MSHERNLKYLNDHCIVYRQHPINDIPDQDNEVYMFYLDGTHECYELFRSKAKITTYKSLKWHMLVLRYLNDNLLDVEFASICHFLADKNNGFVTFFIKSKVLHNMIKEVIGVGDTPPRNRIRKVIFKPYTLLTLSEKLSIVGKLIGRGKKIVEDDIYECMLSLNNEKQKITINKIAKSLSCSSRTIYRNMGNQLKLEKELLNSEL